MISSFLVSTLGSQRFSPCQVIASFPVFDRMHVLDFLRSTDKYRYPRSSIDLGTTFGRKGTTIENEEWRDTVMPQHTDSMHCIVNESIGARQVRKGLIGGALAKEISQELRIGRRLTLWFSTLSRDPPHNRKLLYVARHSRQWPSCMRRDRGWTIACMSQAQRQLARYRE
jgi:hypothetical protein